MKKDRKKAIVFGSSGLVGSYLVKQLCELTNYREVVCINRNPQKIEHPKCKEIVADFDALDEIADKIKGDDVFCCIGTTIKKAGSKAQFTKVDLEIPVAIGKLAERNKTDRFLVVSSIGADKNSSNFYLRTKGEMESKISGLKIPDISIVRPSMLAGPRKEFRFGEKAAGIIMKVISPLMLGKMKNYRAIHAKDVAGAMVIIANSEPTKRIIFESKELQDIANAGM